MSRKAALESVLGLLRGDAACPLADTPESWEAIVRLASAHLVLPALDPALRQLGSANAEASGASAFLAGVHTENLNRNRRMRAALLAFGDAFAGQAVVLKGGAFLLEDADGAAGWRFLSDIDILIPANATTEATAIFEGFGFISARRDYDPERDAHTPALISPCGSLSVELHQRLFAEQLCKPMTARLNGRAETLAQLTIPMPTDRMAHLIAHSQLHHRFHDLKRLHLRDTLDFLNLLDRHRDRIDWADVGKAFSTVHEKRALHEFLAGQQLLLGATADFHCCPPASEDAKAWAVTAVHRLRLSPRARAAVTAFDAGRYELNDLLGNPQRLLRLLSELGNPQLIRQRIRRRAEKFLSATWD